MNCFGIISFFLCLLLTSSGWSKSYLSHFDLDQNEPIVLDKELDYVFASNSIDSINLFKWKTDTKTLIRNSDDKFWIKWQIENDSDRPQTLILIPWGDIYNVNYHIFTESDTTFFETGMLTPFSKRKNKTTVKGVFDITLLPHETGTAYVFVENDHNRGSHFNLRFQTKEKFYLNMINTDPLDYLYLGAILVLIILSTIIFILLKHQSLLYYLFYLSFHTLSIWSLQEHTFHTFKLENVMLLNYIAVLGPQFTFIFFFLFHQKFLSLKKHTPKLYLSIHIWIASKLLLIIPYQAYLLYNNQQGFINSWVFNYHFIESIFTLIMIGIVLYKKVPYSLWISVANFTAIIAYMMATLVGYLNIGNDLFSFMGILMTGLILEAILLFLGMIWQFTQSIKQQYLTFKEMNLALVNHQSKNIELLYFVNHHLRRPVANLLGLNNMLQQTQTNHDQNSKIYEYINEASMDIDTVVVKLNNALENETSTVEDEIKSDTLAIIERILNKINITNPDLNKHLCLKIRPETCTINSQFETFLYHFILMFNEIQKKPIIIKSAPENEPLAYIFQSADMELISHFFNKNKRIELLETISKQNLNLTICKQIAELIKLEIEVNSKEHFMTIKIPN